MALPKGVKSPVDYTKLYMSNELEGELTEKVMTKKDIKKRDEIADAISDKDMKDRYGDKSVKYAIATKIVMDNKKEKKKKDMKEELDEKDKPFVKHLVKKLRKGSKTHAKQADDLEKAMKENTAIESELVIQDWNSDDIKFTEIETVDIIKAKPLKEQRSEWRIDEKFSFLKGLGKTIIKATGSSKLSGLNPRLSKLASFNAAKIRGQNIMSKLLGNKLNVPIDPIVSKNIQTKSIVNQANMAKDRMKTVRKKISGDAVFPTVAQNKIKNEIISDKGISNKNPIKKKFTKKKGDDETPSLMASYDWRAELGEDWQKVNRQDKTDGLSKKAVKAYRRENPGSKLKTAVTKYPKKLKKGSKDAKRRLSFCRRMKGMKKKLTSAKTRRDPDSRINKALRRWNC